MNEEYTCDIGKYTIGVDTNGEDGIGLTVAIINDDGEIHLLGNCYGDNARCIDLLIKENQQLKQQLEQRDKIINIAREKIKLLGKFDGKTCTRGFQMWVADFNNLLEILNIDKGE